jgi:pimeloyl-ACP methyl ester carboxylesterase
LAVTTILALAVSCGGKSTTDPEPTPTPTTGTLTGVVRSSYGDAPVASATVSVGDKQTTSDANGGFTLAGLPPGQRQLLANAPGHAPYSVAISIVAGGSQYDIVMLRLTGELSGIAYRSDTGAPLAGATVSAADAETTSATDGGFQLSGIPVGPVQIEATANGFDPYTASFTVQEGANQHDVHMQEKTFFELGGYGIYIAPEITTVKGVFLFVGGSGGTTSFEMASGEFGPDSHFLAPSTREVILELAEQHGLAVIGSVFHGLTSTEVDGVVAILSPLADATGHPELASAPLAVMGYSFGGCFVGNLVSRHPERVIAFHIFKPSCSFPMDSQTGLAGESGLIPGQFLIADNDEAVGQFGNQAVIDGFQQNRAASSPWSLAVEIGGTHDPSMRLFEFAARWFDAVIPLRLDAQEPEQAPLRPIVESAGWLGNTETFVIAPYATYEDAKGEAAWLPSENAALDWQEFHPAP